MQAFEFLMVLQSIIIGLGMAEILSGLGQLLRAKGTTRIYWLHSVLVFVILMALVLHWWDSWDLQRTTEWTFPAVLIFVLGPIILFLLSDLAFPETATGCDLEEYYYAHTRQIWGLAALYVVVAMSFGPLVFNTHLITAKNLIRGGGLVLCAVLAVSRRKSLHAAGILGAAGLLALYILLFNFWLTR